MIPFIDLKTQYKRIEDKVQKRISDVFAHGQYINGPEIKELNEKLASYIGAKHCFSVSSGTDALIVALKALGIKAGDEVIVPDLSFFATAEIVSFIDAVPVFCDVDPKTYNIDPNCIESLITDKTKAIMPVSLYGQCADVDPINEIARKHNISVVEDGAQSFGAIYKNKKSLNLTEIGCTSFFPAKPLGAYGDAGAIFTNDDNLAQEIKYFMEHGQAARYEHVRVGLNARMDTLQAAFLIEKLAIFDDELNARQEVANNYNKLLDGVVNIPYIESFNTSAYAQYTIQVPDRDKFQANMKAKNVPTSIHYPKVMSEQEALSFLKDTNDCPISKDIASKVVSLPMHPYLEKNMQIEIVEAVKSSL